MKRFRSFVYRTQTLYNWILETTLQSKVFTGYRPYIHINTKFVPLVSICQVTPYKLLICFSSAGVVNSSWRTVKKKQATSAGKLRVNFIDSFILGLMLLSSLVSCQYMTHFCDIFHSWLLFHVPSFAVYFIFCRTRSHLLGDPPTASKAAVGPIPKDIRGGPQLM